ncbi:MAG: hypothetical protein OER92_11845, partial [Alphaproteobacteria bacterium]|nr:hypothetical protein [Alphaproteobacteria bacterium]
MAKNVAFGSLSVTLCHDNACCQALGWDQPKVKLNEDVMIRFALIGMAVTLFVHAPLPAAADPAAEMGKLIEQCGAEQQEAKCAIQF